MLRKITGLLALSLFAYQADAALIHESAGWNGNPLVAAGTSISTNQWLGTPFSVTSAVQVTAIGGTIFAGRGDIFGAIVPLSAPNAVPDVLPMEIDTVALAYTLFNTNDVASDVRVPLSVLLAPGDFALIFGTGLFGATGRGGNNGDENFSIPGTYAFSTDITAPGLPPGFLGRWNGPYASPLVRLVVEGDVVPIPAAIWLLGSALGVLGWMRRG